MSYILDALRKADAQRARDPTRGIYAQPATSIAGGTASGRRREHLFWALIAALILIAALWLWMAAGAVAPPASRAPAADSVARVVSAPATGVRVVPAPAPVSPAAAVLPPAPAPAVVNVMPGGSVGGTAPVAAPPAAVPVAPSPAAERTYSLTELPADVQQALPKFSVSGGVYSGNVAQRMLVVNGQVFNEGSEIASGVVLEQIGPRVALLKFRGLRIAQPY